MTSLIILEAHIIAPKHWIVWYSRLSEVNILAVTLFFFIPCSVLWVRNKWYYYIFTEVTKLYPYYSAQLSERQHSIDINIYLCPYIVELNHFFKSCIICHMMCLTMHQTDHWQWWDNSRPALSEVHPFFFRPMIKCSAWSCRLSINLTLPEQRCQLRLWCMQTLWIIATSHWNLNFTPESTSTWSIFYQK